MALISTRGIVRTGGYPLETVNINPSAILAEKVQEHKKGVEEQEAGVWQLVGVSFDFLLTATPPTLVLATVWERQA